MAKRKPAGHLNGKRDNLKAFTLIEVFLVLVLLTALLGAILYLSTQTINLSSLASSRLIAAELAQEGIEIVRNIKDSNIIAGLVWDANLSPGTYYADYLDHTLHSGASPYLKQDADGHFNYSTGELTPFKRNLIITKINDHHLRINSIVFWSQKGLNFEINVEDHLYEY